MRKRFMWGVFAIAVVSLLGFFFLGSALTAPAQQEIGDPPEWLAVTEVHIQSQSGSLIHGWYYAPDNVTATVVLLHPVRGNRRSMLGRARFLSNAGLAVLLVDFQAHGESVGERITFGHLESKDAAAALLAQPALEVDGLILEAVFPTIQLALENRLRLRLGGMGARFTSVLASQMESRFGIALDELAPVDKAREIQAPVFVVSGENDLRTTKADTELLYDSFGSQKQMWLVPGATHQDLHAYATEEYEKRILEFIRQVTKPVT